MEIAEESCLDYRSFKRDWEGLGPSVRPDTTIKTRCQILLLSAKPMSVPQIAQVTFSSEDTVARCIHEFNQSSLDALLPKPTGGRPPKITKEYLKRLLDDRARSQNTRLSFLELDRPTVGRLSGRTNGYSFG